MRTVRSYGASILLAPWMVFVFTLVCLLSVDRVNSPRQRSALRRSSGPKLLDTEPVLEGQTLQGTFWILQDIELAVCTQRATVTASSTSTSNLGRIPERTGWAQIWRQTAERVTFRACCYATFLHRVPGRIQESRHVHISMQHDAMKHYKILRELVTLIKYQVSV